MSVSIVKRITSIVLALMFAVSVAMVPLAVADIGSSDTEPETDGDETDADAPVNPQAADDQQREDDSDDLAPGEQLAGVVGVQQTELNGEVSERAYGIKIASAQSDSARADVASEQLSDVENRLDELETVREELDAAYENDEISYGEYRAKLAITVAEQRTIERMATNTAATVEGLDDDLLAERDIDADEVRASVDRAATLGGFDVSQLVHSIVGERAGKPIVADPAEPWIGDRDTTDTDVADVDVDDLDDVDADDLDDVDADDLDDVDADDLTDVAADDLTDIDADDLTDLETETDDDSE